MSIDLSSVNNIDAFVETYTEINGQPKVSELKVFSHDTAGFQPFGPAVTEEDVYAALNDLQEKSGKKFVPGLGYL